MFRFAALLVFASFALESTANSFATEIPFTSKDGFLWIDVKTANSDQPLRFVLDSGASCSVLDLSAARRLRARLHGRVQVQGVNTETSGYWPVRLKASAHGVPLSREYLGLDLTALSGKCSSNIDGLIGLDFFKDRVVQIDFEASTLRILEEAPAESHDISLPLQTRACGLLVPITVNGRTDQWMRVDTGCVSALQWVAPQMRPEECMGRRVAVGLTRLSLAEAETSVQLGAAKFEGIKTGIHSRPIFPGEAGLLGLGMLQNLKSVVIDSPGDRLVFTR